MKAPLGFGRYRPWYRGLTASVTIPLSALFENGESGGIYYATGTMWQDTAKTVPVDAIGDPIRVWEPSEGPTDSTAPSDSARPVLA